MHKLTLILAKTFLLVLAGELLGSFNYSLSKFFPNRARRSRCAARTNTNIYHSIRIHASTCTSLSICSFIHSLSISPDKREGCCLSGVMVSYVRLSIERSLVLPNCINLLPNLTQHVALWFWSCLFVYEKSIYWYKNVSFLRYEYTNNSRKLRCFP